jgi:hypothetical protein
LKKILISCENEQELLELRLVLKELKKERPLWKFIFFDTNKIFKGNEIVYDSEFFDRVYSSVNSFNRNFKELSKLEKLKVIIKNIFLLRKIFKKEKIDLFLTGVPLVFFRFAHISLSQKPIYISYVRSFLTQREVPHSLSDKLNRFSQNIPVLKKLSVFNNWYSDFIVTIGTLNRKYFISRGIFEEKVIISGPLLLDFYRRRIKNTQGIERKERIETVYLLSTAFRWHNDYLAHEEQKKVIESFFKIYHLKYRNSFKLIFRPHPRDNINEYKDIVKKYDIMVDKGEITELIGNFSPRTVLVSTLSTLNLEWEYLGGKSIFISTPLIFERYRNFYETLNINPVFSPYDAFNKLIDAKIEQYNLNNIFYTHKEGNIQFFKNFILQILEN